jgi:hypothetical protein
MKSCPSAGRMAGVFYYFSSTSGMINKIYYLSIMGEYTVNCFTPACLMISN